MWEMGAGMMPSDVANIYPPWPPATEFPHTAHPVDPISVPDEHQKRPPTLEPLTLDPDSGCMRAFWHVPKKKLESKDTHPHVSSQFTVPVGTAFPSVPFKLMITPKVANDAKGGASFKKAKGKGYVELSCEATLPEDAPEVQFRIGVGKEKETSKTETRGTVSHNFHQQKIGRLPKDQAEWNFESAVDSTSSNFVVCLEILQNENTTN